MDDGADHLIPAASAHQRLRDPAPPPPGEATASRRLRLAVRCGSAAATLSRRTGFGSGSIIGGRVTLSMYPRALSALTSGRRVILVSGTNGKTTTSHMIAAALGTSGQVAHNATGSNMADGAVSALMSHPEAHDAVLETDELHLAALAASCAPAAIVLLNLTRDQLDRAAEVRRTAMAIGRALAELPHTVVFANADDPMAVWAVGRAVGPVVWVAAGSDWREDARSCPSCGHLLQTLSSGWSCDCGLTRPVPDWWCDADTAYGPRTCITLRLALPGEVNRANALTALAVADACGVEHHSASAAIAGLREIAGRYATVRSGARELRLLLAKNPAGWSATLKMVPEGRPLLVLINAREADGRDTSWLWDLDCRALSGRAVVVSGDRAADLGVRLSYAGVPHLTESDPLTAIGMLPLGAVDVIANYTAFHFLRRELVGTTR